MAGMATGVTEGTGSAFGVREAADDLVDNPCSSSMDGGARVADDAFVEGTLPLVPGGDRVATEA